MGVRHAQLSFVRIALLHPLRGLPERLPGLPRDRRACLHWPGWFHRRLPGPIGSVVSPGLFGCENFGQLAQASSLCVACKEACPVDIDLPELLLRVRAGKAKEAAKSKKQAEGIGIPVALKWGLKAFQLAAGTPTLFAFGQRLGGLFSRIYSPQKKYMRIPAWTGWGYSKDFPRFATSPFHARWKKMKQEVNNEDQVPGKQNETSIPELPIAQSLADQFADELSAIGSRPIVSPRRMSKPGCGIAARARH